ncbi:hypothetical protein [Ohtaekwangia koreensis]|uniref:Uncharacterized protein n=1 Tax=Ohtaekwangia koreensis TaxID=688867 RepID=A0A1T5J847_9BACT|nr:hypothetical protein [Ohtaekwangia koreensis]SKC47549.1 hypothetical protein SAMN05660236_0859 [Ohtaekwangia koreensis]
MKFLTLLVLLQPCVIFYSYGQEVNLKVRQATDEVCLCMEKTRTKDEERECLKKFSSSIIDVSLSNEDTLYIKGVFKNKCGIGKDSKCSFLNESDLAGYKLKKASVSIYTIEWQAGDSTNGNVVSLMESRSDFKTKQEALDNIKKIWGSADSNGDVVFSKKDGVFTDIRVYYTEWIDNAALYQILVQKNNTLETVTLTMKQDDRSIVMKILDKVLSKMKTDCK